MSFSFKRPAGPVITRKTSSGNPRSEIASAIQLSFRPTKLTISPMKLRAISPSPVTNKSEGAVVRSLVDLAQYDRFDDQDAENNFTTSAAIASNTFLSRAKDSGYGSKSRLRTVRPLNRPGEHKMLGLWEQYEDTWFNIHSTGVKPLFEDFPLPTIVQSLNDLDDPIKEIDEDKEPAENVSPRKHRQYKIRTLKSKAKLKQIEESIIPCDKCRMKKRKCYYISCGHQFCKDCLQSHIQTHLSQMKVPVFCLKDGCSYELERKEIAKHAANSEDIVKFFDLNVADYVRRRPHKMVQCFTPSCKFVIDITKSANKNSISCPRCKLIFCLACHQPFKNGRHRCEDLHTKSAAEQPESEVLYAGC